MGLSGPRVKQRIQADPRNLNWSSDKSTFGFKMLQKMGWKEGKGLGAREDGQVENVTVLKKENLLGVGASKRTVDNWMENTQAFDALLQSLNTSQIDTASVSEEVIQSSESKVETEALKSIPEQQRHGRLFHRMKFQRAKQQVMQSSKDLQAVLGVRTQEATSVEQTSADSTLEMTREQSSLTTVSSLSTGDYFKQKMEKLKALKGIAGGMNHSKYDDSDEGQERVGMGFQGLGQNTESASENTITKQSSDSTLLKPVESMENSTETERERKKDKRKKKSKEEKNSDKSKKEKKADKEVSKKDKKADKKKSKKDKKVDREKSRTSKTSNSDEPVDAIVPNAESPVKERKSKKNKSKPEHDSSSIEIKTDKKVKDESKRSKKKEFKSKDADGKKRRHSHIEEPSSSSSSKERKRQTKQEKSTSK